MSNDSFHTEETFELPSVSNLLIFSYDKKSNQMQEYWTAIISEVIIIKVSGEN